MYDWLAGALDDSAQLVTASRRLARVLRQEFGGQQLAAGRTAWRTPQILALPDWLASLLATTTDGHDVPVRITADQGRLIWEQCLRQEIRDPLFNVGRLAHEASDTWTRLCEWRVRLEDCEQEAHGRDKRLFLRAAYRYTATLQAHNWVDRAGLPGLVTEMVSARRIAVPVRVTFAGFDRIVPAVQALLDALAARSCSVAIARPEGTSGSGNLYGFETTMAEMRAAGAWAREQLERAPEQRIAIIVPQLERDASQSLRLVREGLVPGWQNATRAYASAVNVSYGRKLASYPAIAIALLALRWLEHDLSTSEVGMLLRSPLLGLPATDERSRLDLRLRRVPDRAWSPQMLVGFGQGASAAAGDWLERTRRLAGLRRRMPRRHSPTAWAAQFDRILADFSWPGTRTLTSFDLQLVNRWRELLNEFARLELVEPRMTLPEALGRLAALARGIVFQPEAEGEVVQLLGPLEAAGMRFDQLWIAGFSAANWPPPGRPLPLVSRELQRRRGMPDADPHDTLDYARRVVRRLVGSAPKLVVSYALTDGDTDQTVSGLVGELDVTEAPAPADPGWHARNLVGGIQLQCVASEAVPAVQPGEAVVGGALTLQRQRDEPFSAFVYGRLGVRRLDRLSTGLAPNIRGKLIHDALRVLYARRPTSADIADWNEQARTERIAAAVEAAFRPRERHADGVLRRLLALERKRVARLLEGVLEIDRAREPFTVDAVEHDTQAVIGDVPLQLRFDRIDRLDDGGVVILDYKTGRPARLLDRHGEVNDMQLVAYSCALNDPVVGIGLINIDSRAIGIDAAGPAFGAAPGWSATLSRWQSAVRELARELADGDVRMSSRQSAPTSRALGLLSRYGELDLDG